jgi:hypothetical protein
MKSRTLERIQAVLTKEEARIAKLQPAMDQAIADNDYEAQRRIAREMLGADE